MVLLLLFRFRLPPSSTRDDSLFPYTTRFLSEYGYKDEALGDPLIAEDHIECVNCCSREELHDIQDMALRINDFMSGLFAGVGIRLVDFKLEFGRIWDGDYSRIILADEISPDGCRLWDMVPNEKLDKQRFPRSLGGEVEANQIGRAPGREKGWQLG